MKVQTLKVATRVTNGKGPARQARAEGLLPCVLYGGEGQAVSLRMNRREFEHVVRGRGGEHAVVQIEVEDSPALNTAALVKAVQHDPIRGDILHADLLRIRLDEKIVTVVPVRLVGHAVGIVEGGVLDHLLRDIEVECLALEVPDEIVVDVSNIHLGESCHVAQIDPPANVTIVTDPARTVAVIHAPRVLKEEKAGEEAVAEGEAAAAPEGPEVISERKGKEKEEES